jgi:hypothetical protein
MRVYTVIKKTPLALREYMESNPDSVFVWFTNGGRDGGFIDKLLRRVLSLKYTSKGFTFENSFSHVGLTWWESGLGLMAYHQTFPFFKKEVYKPEVYNEIFEIRDPELCKYAKLYMQSELRIKRGYGVLQVIMMGPQILFGLKNPYTDGKVCSETIVHALSGALGGMKPDSTDPNGLFLGIKKSGKAFRHIVADFEPATY